MTKLFFKLKIFIYNYFYWNNTYFYPYKFDNLATRANLSFLNNENFIHYNNTSVQFTGRDYRFYFRLHQALWCAENSLNKNGVFVELGTGRGYIFSAISELVQKRKIVKDIFLFDTFLPFKVDVNTGEQNNKQIRSVFYANDYISVKEKFSKYEFVNVIQGRCPEILTKYFRSETSITISFLHIDLNYHEAEIESLIHLWNFFEKGTIILLDDYANPHRQLQNQAFDEFFYQRGYTILTTGSGQGIVLI